MAICDFCGKQFTFVSVHQTTSWLSRLGPTILLCITPKICPECVSLYPLGRDLTLKTNLLNLWGLMRSVFFSRFPLITLILTALNILVFIAMSRSGGWSTQFDDQRLILWGAGGQYDLTQSGRLFSSMFLHINLAHLLVNMVFLVAVGAVAEPVLGDWTFLLLYFLTGMGGGVAYILSGSLGSWVGASGAIFGLFGGLLGLFCLRWNRLRWARKYILFWLFLFVACQLWTHNFVNPGHLGGFVTGLGIGSLMPFPPVDLSTGRPCRRMLLVAGGVLVLLVSAAVIARVVQDPLVQLTAAGKFLDAGQTDRAIEKLRGVIASRPGLATAHYRLGLCYLEKKQYDTAAAALERSSQLSPNDTAIISALEGAYLRLGREYLLENRLTDAETVFRKSVAVSPKLPEGHYGLGLTLLLQGHSQEARDRLEEYLKLSPDKSEARRILRGLYQMKGLSDKAKNVLGDILPPEMKGNP